MHHPTRRGWKVALFAGLAVALMAMAPPNASSMQTAAKKIGISQNRAYVENISPPRAVSIAVDTATMTTFNSRNTTTKYTGDTAAVNSTGLNNLAMMTANIRSSGSTSPPNAPTKKNMAKMTTAQQSILRAANTPNISTAAKTYVNPAARRIAGRSLA